MNLPDDAPTTTTAQASILAFHDASEKGTKLVGKEGHICALSNLGNVYCGGPNGLLMGTANPTASFVPMLADVVDIAMAEGAMCAVKKNGTVWCWGNNDKGQLGQNPATVTSSAQPMQIVDGL
jgi:alpha-tubulin suppressor-like RCC1 family protein